MKYSAARRQVLGKKGREMKLEFQLGWMLRTWKTGFPRKGIAWSDVFKTGDWSQLQGKDWDWGGFVGLSMRGWRPELRLCQVR